MKTHVRRGYNLLNHLAFLAGAAEIVLTHHEQFDGGGYPQGLSGTKIPLGARIFAVADTLDAMTSDRPYRPATTFAVAREEIIQQSGKQFDPAVVSAFLAIDQGVWAELRVEQGINEVIGDRSGEVLATHSNRCMRFNPSRRSHESVPVEFHALSPRGV